MVSFNEPSVPTSGRIAYDDGYSCAVTNPDDYVQNQGDNPGYNQTGLPEASVSFAYLSGSNWSVGGETGSAFRNGFSTGIDKLSRNVHHFTGRYVRFQRRQIQNDTGPVGRSNYAGKLYSGVNEQFSPNMPSLEEIYRGFTGG